MSKLIQNSNFSTRSTKVFSISFKTRFVSNSLSFIVWYYRQCYHFSTTKELSVVVIITAVVVAARECRAIHRNWWGWWVLRIWGWAVWPRSCNLIHLLLWGGSKVCGLTTKCYFLFRKLNCYYCGCGWGQPDSSVLF